MHSKSPYAIAAAALCLSLQTSESFTPVVNPTTTTTNKINTLLGTLSSLQLSAVNYDEYHEHDVEKYNKGGPSSFSSKISIRQQIKAKAKPIAISTFSILSTSLFTNVKPSFASAPVTPIRQFKPQDQKKIALDKIKLERNKKAMQEQMEHQLKCEEIEQRDGKAAREAYEKEYEAKKIKEGEERVVKRKELLYALLGQGICPFMDLEGERQVYLFDHGIDLATVPSTPQQKEFMNLRRNPKLVQKRLKERFIIKCIVEDLVARGQDPLEFMENNKDKTMEIFGMSDKKLDAVASKYQSIIESQGTLSGIKSEVPFDVAAAVGFVTNTIPAGIDPVTVDKAAAKEEAAKLKAQKRAEKEALKAEKQAAKAAAKAEAARVKAETKAAQEAAKAAAATKTTESELELAEYEVDFNDQLKSEEVTLSDEEAQPGESHVAVTSKHNAVKKSIPVVPIVGVVGVAGGGVVFKNIKEKNAAAEEERQKQFRMIMGLDINDDDDNEDDGGDDDEDIVSTMSSTYSSSENTPAAVNPVESQPKADDPPKKRRIGLSSVFSKKGSNRETDLNKLIAPGAVAPDFSTLLAKLLTFGAPGRFPLIKTLPGGMPLEKFDLEEAKKLLVDSRKSTSLTDEVSAEAFACVVNCMIIDIIDLASSSLGEEKKSRVTVDALNVVMDFMDHAASLFDSVADGVTITPVTYGGTLSKSKLEKMFTIYASSMMTSLEGGVTQDRVDTLQQVFNINDKRAEGLIQKGMMKNLMNMMKNPEAMEGMEGMEGLADMMGAMGGEGLPGFDPNGEVSPEQLKQSVQMMKELVDSGSVSKEELNLVRQQFQEVYGSDINELIKAADEEGTDDLGEDGKELLDLFKTILKED